MKTTLANSSRLNILGNEDRSSDQEMFPALPRQWRQKLGYCSIVAAVPAILASQVQEARSHEAKKPEATVAENNAKVPQRLNVSSSPALLKRQSAFRLPHQKGDVDLLATLAGTDDCPGGTIPGGTFTIADPYIVSGNTTGANNTVTHLQYYYYYSFDSPGPDHVYSFTLSGRGANPQIEVSTPSGTYKPLVYILYGGTPESCPAGTGNSGYALVSSGTNGNTTTLSSGQINFLPLNTPLHLFVDSFVNDASGSGPYTIRMQDVTIAPVPGCTNSIDCAGSFVRQHYLDFLNREPDAAGLAFWTNEILSCGGDDGCIEAKRINVSAAYFLSIEFQETGYLVYRSYKAAFGNLPNAPVPLKFNEFTPETQQIGQGVIVNQPGWEQALENNKQAFALGFVQRTRFTSAYPSSLPPDQFVDLLFMNAGVTPSSTDRDAAINEFGVASTSADTAARARALRRVAENSTLKQQELNRAFVLMQYFGYLRRNPNESPEPGLNFDGYNFWLNKLNSFNGSFIDAEMVKAFLISTEYRQRFGP